MKDHERLPSLSAGSASTTPEIPAVINHNKLLGSGCYAKVYAGQWNGLEVAVKVPLGARAADRDRTRQEIRLWRRMSHPNISQFLCEYSNREGTQINIVSELADGDLASRILRSKDEIPLLHRLYWARDVLEGLRHMHSNHMVHRDLKLVNVLYTVPPASPASTTLPLPIAKLTDFGMCQLIPVSCGYLIDPPRRPLGTPLYMAPEALTGGRITTKVDIYSFGMVLWELIMRTEVFKHMTEYHAFVRAVVGGERPPLDALPHAALRPLLLACWELNAKKRPTADEALVMLQHAIDVLLSPSLSSGCLDAGETDEPATSSSSSLSSSSPATPSLLSSPPGAAASTSLVPGAPNAPQPNNHNPNLLAPASENTYGSSSSSSSRPVSPLPSRTASPSLRASPGMAAASVAMPSSPSLCAPVPASSVHSITNVCAALEAASVQHLHPNHYNHQHNHQHNLTASAAAAAANNTNHPTLAVLSSQELAKPPSSKQRACWREPMSPSRTT